MAIPYVRDLDVVHGRVDRVSPLVRRVVADNPGKFTYRGTGTYLVGRGEVAVIDPGPALPGHIDAVLGALEPGERMTHLLVTHTHSDHSPGAALLQPRCGAPTFGFGPHGAVAPDDPTDVVVFGDPDADGRSAGSGTGDELREGADTHFRPDVVVRDGDEVSGPGWTLRALHTPGHTSNHLCFELVEERSLFTGDHVMGWSTTVIGPPDGDLARFMDSLARLLERDDERYWPTHGPVVEHPKELVRAYVAHRRERTAQVLGVLGRGPATIAEIVPVLYADVDKALWRAASASTYAHLLALVCEGRVASDGEARRTSRYRLRS